MASAADSIRLPDLITKWMEVQKSRVGLDDENPLRVDVIDLTLLLKSIGLKLEYLDFEPEKSNTDTLTVDIKCNRSGVMARLSYDLVDCSCPEKDDREASFWEVQATGPKVFSKHKNNTSSNLLPEVSENCSIVSKAMLSNLLDYYRTSINTIERGEDALQSPLRMAPPKICITSPATPPAEGKITPKLGSSFSNNNPAWSPAKTRSLDESLDRQSQESEQKAESKVNSSTTSIETREICPKCCGGDKPIKTIITTKEFTVSAMPDDNSFANSEAMRALITSSPNEKDFNSPFYADQNHERDLNVIHCMQQARQQIDAAMLIMRLNNPSRELTEGASAVTTTPQTVVRKNLLPERPNSLNNINRRMSLPGRAANTPKPTVNGTALSQPKKPVPVSKVLTAKSAVTARRDTPRPTACPMQCGPSVLRKAASVTSVSATTKSSSTTVTKKPTTVLKPMNRSAITSKVSTGLTGKSVNSSTVNKK